MNEEFPLPGREKGRKPDLSRLAGLSLMPSRRRDRSRTVPCRCRRWYRRRLIVGNSRLAVHIHFFFYQLLQRDLPLPYCNRAFGSSLMLSAEGDFGSEPR